MFIRTQILKKKSYKNSQKLVIVCLGIIRKRVALEKRNLNILVLILVLLPKIHKCLFDVPGPPVISNCGTPTEKVSEHLMLKLVMQQSKSYIKDSSDFIKKLKEIKGWIQKNSKRFQGCYYGHGKCGQSLSQYPS